MPELSVFQLILCHEELVSRRLRGERPHVHPLEYVLRDAGFELAFLLYPVPRHLLLGHEVLDEAVHCLLGRYLIPSGFLPEVVEVPGGERRDEEQPDNYQLLVIDLLVEHADVQHHREEGYD